MTHNLEHRVDPKTREVRVGDLATEIVRNSSYRLSREAAERIAGERMKFLEDVVNHLMESEADGEKPVQLEIPDL